MMTNRSGMELASLRKETTRQATTFNLGSKQKTIDVPRGRRVTIAQGDGQGYIAQLWLTFPGWFWQHWNPTAPVAPTILKTLILRIYWDGQSVPAIQAPVGDFFGNGLCEMRSFTSRYFGMSSGGFYCKFPMPFSKGFRVEVENLDERIDTQVFANVLYQQTPERPNNCGYLHAQFNTGINSGAEPIHILEAHGRGHLAGCCLAGQGKQQSYLSFLEAPEYIYVDEDWQKPRVIGTGLEDYFLGGWYFREGEFAGELHGAPLKDTLNSSVAMYRVHEADAIRFEQRLRFDFVNPWAPERLKPFAWSAVGFHYLDKPEGENREIPPVKDLLCWYRIKDVDHLSVP